MYCNPSLGGSASDCDNPADWNVVPLPATNFPYGTIGSFAVYNNTLYAMMGGPPGDGSGGNQLYCNPTIAGDPAICDSTQDWTEAGNSYALGNDTPASTVYNGRLYWGIGAGTPNVVVCSPTIQSGNDNPVLCDSTEQNAFVFSTPLTDAQLGYTDGNVLSMISYDGVMFIGYGGTQVGNGLIYSWKDYGAPSADGGQFTETPSLAVYNGVLYAGRGQTGLGPAPIYYYKNSQTESNQLQFQAGSSTGSIWFSQESLNNSGVGQAAGVTSGVFKFSSGLVTDAGAYDLAESYPTADSSLEPGDVVAIDSSLGGQNVKKSSGQYDNKAFGVVSTNPGFTLSSHATAGVSVPVALAGRVPVKFSFENGPVSAGDALTSASLPGYAMKATQSGVIIGRTLESYSLPEGAATSSATGTLTMIVQNGYFFPTEGSSVVAPFGNSSTDTASYLQGAQSTPDAQLPVGSQIAQGIGVQTLVAGVATFTQSVSVIGTTSLFGPVILGGMNSGEVNVPPGKDKIDVTFATPFAFPPHVYLTPEVTDVSGGLGYDGSIWSGNYYLTNRTAAGFEIRLPGGGYCPTVSAIPCPIRVSFMWFVVGLDGESFPEGTTSTISGQSSTSIAGSVSGTDQSPTTSTGSTTPLGIGAASDTSSTPPFGDPAILTGTSSSSDPVSNSTATAPLPVDTGVSTTFPY
jgi:hypothetical protein